MVGNHDRFNSCMIESADTSGTLSSVLRWEVYITREQFVDLGSLLLRQAPWHVLKIVLRIDAPGGGN